MNPEAFFSESASSAVTPSQSENDSASTSQWEVPTRPRRINPYKMFVGSFVPNWLLCRREISQGAKLCYARLAQFAGEDGLCYPKQTTLASELGVAERTVRDYIRELEESNLIESVQNGLRRANDYYFLDHHWIFERCPDAPIPSGEVRPVSAVPTDEENQLKENEVHTHRTRGLPRNEAEAVEAARVAGIPEDFGRTEFNRMEAVNWLDGCQRPVRSWPHYIKQRWSKEQSERAERKAQATARPGRHGSFVPPRKFDSANYKQSV